MDKQTYQALQTVDCQQCLNYFRGYGDDKMGKTGASVWVALPALAALTYLRQQMTAEDVVSYLKHHVLHEMTQGILLRLWEKYTEAIEKATTLFAADELMAAILSDSLYGGRDELYTPPGLSMLVQELLELKDQDVLLDLGSGRGSFLFNTAATYRSIRSYGVEINTDSVVVSHIRNLLFNGQVQYAQSNIFTQSFEDLGANKVYAFSPLAMQVQASEALEGEFTGLKELVSEVQRTYVNDWMFQLSAYANQKKPGKTVCVMTNGGLFNLKDEVFRKILVERGAVEGVIMLPPRLLNGTGISVSLLILSQDNLSIRLVDASELYTSGRRYNTLEENHVKQITQAYKLDTDISKSVSMDEIRANQYVLFPARYLTYEDTVKDGYPLGQVTESIYRGVMLRSSELDERATLKPTRYRYLQSQHIEDGRIKSDLPYLDRIDTREERALLKENCLVISRSAPFKLALAKLPVDQFVLASGNLYVIKFDDAKVDPAYAAAYLQSNRGQAQLLRLAAGTSIHNLSLQQLEAVQLPKLPMEQQRKIAKGYEQVQKQLVVLDRQRQLILEKKERIVEEAIYGTES